MPGKSFTIDAMTYLLFPGRHLLNTAFQERYLRTILQMPLAELDFWQGAPWPSASKPLDHIIFAVTSANQANSRYNPIPFHVRAIGVDRFARPMEMTFGVRYRIIGIPHFRPTPRFAEFTLKEIEEQTDGNLRLTPENCVVLCSTTAVIEQYQKLGFAILPAELDHPDKPPTPNKLLQKIVQAGESWHVTASLRAELTPSTFDLWQDFPDIPRRVLRLWRDPLLNDAGSLTAERDYASYAYGMSNPAIMQIKYEDIKEAIVPGKIVDEGCADGALLALVARDFPDSDLIGIDIAAEFIARCQERQRAGDFGGSYVYFHQRNIMQPVFEEGSIDTTICNSTMHEIWSYGSGAASVRAYLALKFAQLRRGGRLLIRDVVGPEEGDREVYLWLNEVDGRSDNVLAPCEDGEALEAYLAEVSTYGRFLRFTRDFKPGVGAYRIEQIAGQSYAVLSWRGAVEFMSKKDYIDNWDSEMHEAFAFWAFSDWKAALTAAGFTVLETPNEPERGSRAYTNPWIVANRWAGKVALFKREGGELRPLPWPPTNVVLVAEKR